MGALVDVPGYYAAAGGRSPGIAFGTPASGFRADTTTAAFAGLDAYVLVDAGTP